MKCSPSIIKQNLFTDYFVLFLGLYICVGCIEETNEPIEGSGDAGGGVTGGNSNANNTGADSGLGGGIDDGVTQEEMNLTCFNLMIDVLNSQIELQVCNLGLHIYTLSYITYADL